MPSTRPPALLAFGLVAIGALAWAGQPTKRPSDEERGRTLYERHCVQCHGVTAAGDGPVAAALVRPVPDLRGAALDPERREANVAVVLAGKGLMPSYQLSFDRYDARRLMRHMERVARDPDAADAPEDEEPVDTDEPSDGPDGN